MESEGTVGRKGKVGREGRHGRERKEGEGVGKWRQGKGSLVLAYTPSVKNTDRRTSMLQCIEIGLTNNTRGFQQNCLFCNAIETTVKLSS